MTDQHRWDALGCTGDWVDTPNIDRLAAEGVRFANAYSNSPVCVPARVSLATGQYPHNTDVWHNQRHTLPPESPTWMRAIRDAGYATSVFGKTHLHPHLGDLREREHLLHAYGLDVVDEISGPRAATRSRTHMTQLWRDEGVYGAYKKDIKDRYDNKPWVVRPSPLPFELYSDVYVGQRAVKWLNAYGEDRPWFCWVSFGGPHEPWDTPEPFASRYDPADMPPPVEQVPDDHERPRGLLDEKLEQRPELSRDEIAALRADYAGNVALIDDQIGQVLKVVKKRHDLDNTVIAFVSDHGEMNGDHGLLYKQNFLNGAVRVPMIVRLAPDAAAATAGRVSDALVELMDLGPTLVDAVGGQPVEGSRARSLMPVIADPAREHREVALSELRREAMVANRDWKLATNPEGEVYLLYDLRADPQETRNLAGLPEYEDVQRDLTAHLQTVVEATR